MKDWTGKLFVVAYDIGLCHTSRDNPSDVSSFTSLHIHNRNTVSSRERCNPSRGDDIFDVWVCIVVRNNGTDKLSTSGNDDGAVHVLYKMAKCFWSYQLTINNERIVNIERANPRSKGFTEVEAGPVVKGGPTSNAYLFCVHETNVDRFIFCERHDSNVYP